MITPVKTVQPELSTIIQSGAKLNQAKLHGMSILPEEPTEPQEYSTEPMKWYITKIINNLEYGITTLLQVYYILDLPVFKCSRNEPSVIKVTSQIPWGTEVLPV